MPTLLIKCLTDADMYDCTEGIFFICAMARFDCGMSGTKYTLTTTALPRGLNFRALETRLRTTWGRRKGVRERPRGRRKGVRERPRGRGECVRDHLQNTGVYGCVYG